MTLTFAHAVLLFVAALGGGVLNSVAGGGSFLSFPALLFSGYPAIESNATSTVALWPGAMASVSAYRQELGKANRTLLLLLTLCSLHTCVLGTVAMNDVDLLDAREGFLMIWWLKFDSC